MWRRFAKGQNGGFRPGPRGGLKSFALEISYAFPRLEPQTAFSKLVAPAPVLCLYGSRLTNCSTEQYYTDPAAYARGRAAIRETFRPAVRTMTEWDVLAIPDSDNHPRLVFFHEIIKRMAGESKGDIPVALLMPSLLDYPKLIFGLDGWIEMILFDRPAAEKAVLLFARQAGTSFAEGLVALSPERPRH